MFENARFVAALDVRPSVGTTFVTQQQRVALRIVTRVLGFGGNPHQTTITILTMTGRNTFRYDGTTGVLAQVNHFGARVGLLVVVGHGNGVELAHGVVAQKHAARVFPSDGRTRLDLRPRNLGAVTAAEASLCDEVIHAALTVLVTRIPVLHRGVFHFGIRLGDDFHDGGMELVFVALRSRAAFHVTHIRAFVGHDERALKLACVGRIDAEIGGQLQGATHTFRDVAERAVAEDCRVECCEEVVGIRYHLAEVFLHQVGMLLDGLTERHEYDAML